MKQRVAIIADDLTGAGDTAARFWQAGWTTELRLRRGASEAEVVALSTDSRARAADEAAERVRCTTQELVRTGTRRLYKKIDSTLRGPLRAEIDGLLDTLGPDTVAVVCPAFPAVGRTLVDGTLLVHGRPVTETATARDPVTPVPDAHLPTLLDAPLLRSHPGETPASWADRVRSAGRIVVVDAADEAELEQVASLVTALGQHALPVGSAGLAGPLARSWRSTSGTALVVVTTAHDATREQADTLRCSGTSRYEPAGWQLRDDAEWASFSDDVLAAAASQPAKLLLSAPPPAGDDIPPELVADRLAELAVRVVCTAKVSGLVITGGDGARAVLARLGGTGIRLHGEVTPGVPLGSVVGGPVAGLPVATKAGGFGEPDVLIKAADAVERTRSSR